MIVSMDDVRFGGVGFVPFPGGLPGPSGIGFASEWMRAAIPLHLQHGSAAGTFQIKPFREGAFGLSWAVVARTDCGESQVTETAAFRTEIVSRRASIVVHDLYDYSLAKSVIETQDGRHRLLVFDGFFQIFDVASGAKIVDRRGYCPDFSPTGRFVAALTDYSGGECEFNTVGSGTPKFEVIDLVSGNVVAEPDPPAVWAHGDAFLFVPNKWWKMLQPPGHVLSLIVDREDNAANAPLIEVSEGWSIRLMSDLGLIVHARHDEEDDAGDAYNLLTGTTLRQSSDEARNGDLLATAVRRGLRSYAAPADDPTFQASHLRYIDRLDEVFENFGATTSLVARSPIRPLRTDASSRIVLSGEDTGAMLAAGVARGAASLARGRAGGARVLELASKLSGTSIEAADPVMSIGGDLWSRMLEIDATDLDDDAKAEVYNSRNDAIREEIARRVVADAPQAAAVFDQEMGCWPQGGRLVDNLSGAWRYAQPGRVVWLTHAGCQAIGTVGNLAINQLDLFIRDADGSRHYNLLYPDDDWSGVPPIDEVEALYGSMVSATTGAPMKIEDDYHQLLEFRDLNPAFVAGRFIVLSVLDRLYVVNHRDLTMSGPVRLASSGRGATFGATRDGRHFIQVNEDGSLAVHRLDNGESVLRGRYVDDELVLFDDAGHFVSTRDGASYVHLQFQGRPQLYSLAQLSGALERPDLVRAALSGTTKPTISTALTAPPLLAITLDDAGAGKGQVALDIRATSATGLLELRIFADGALVENRPLEGNMLADTLFIAIPGGARWVTAVATDIEGSESQPVSLPVGAGNGERDEDGGRLFAVVVGTDVYDDASGLTRLNHAVSDARRFADLVENLEGGLYRKAEVAALLLDDADVEKKLEATLDELSRQTGPADTIMLFFAGHGLRGSDERFYLASRKTSLEQLDTTGLSWDRLAAQLGQLQGRVAVFLDACHSGGADDAVNDGAVDALVDGAAGSVAVIAASKGRQFSFESAAKGGGFFTSALSAIVSARSDPSIDRDGSGAVELDELYLALKRQVVRDSNGQQTPWIARNQMVGKVPLF